MADSATGGSISCQSRAWTLAAAVSLGSMAASPAQALSFDPENLWPRGAILKVCFLNGSAAEREFVARTAPEWTRHGGLRFDFGWNPAEQGCRIDENHAVRIVFSQSETRTFPGPKSAQEVLRGNPTMSLAIGPLLRRGEAEARRVVLHEFGHLLGFEHEEASPGTDCLSKVDWPQLKRVAGLERGQLLGRGAAETRLRANAPDPLSIMGLGLAPHFLARRDDPGQCPVAHGSELSQLDKEGMALAYPAGQAEGGGLVQPLPIRQRLDQAIGLASILASAVVPLDASLPQAGSEEVAEDGDRAALAMLTLLAAQVASKLVADPSNANAPYVQPYRAGQYREAYDRARAAQRDGDRKAALLLAGMLLQGQGKPKDLENALTWIRAAEEAKLGDGYLLAGVASLHGLGVPRDGARAERQLRAADMDGNAVAAHILGAMYFTGQVVKQSIPDSFAFFARAAKAGLAPSKRALAVLYDQGLGVARDGKMALEMARAAAESADAAAMVLLAIYLADGVGTAANPSQAIKYIEAAAASGHPLAHAVLGLMHEEGYLGLKPDRAKAIEHYGKADALRAPPVWFRMAELSLPAGDSGAKSAVTALRKAADAGMVRAQLRLAALYRDGLGTAAEAPVSPSVSADPDPYPVAVDRPRAFAWLTLASLYASESDREVAQRELNEISRKLNRTGWVAGTDFAVARVKRREGLLEEVARSIPAGVATRDSRSLAPPKSTGSGVIVSTQGLILTNQHVVEDCTSVRVTAGGKAQPATVLHPDKVQDLALLEIEYLPGFTAKFRSQDIKQGDQVVVMGYPVPKVFGDEPGLMTPNGTVTAMKGANGSVGQFATNAFINPGNSGGPVFDMYGNIAGIAVMRVAPDVMQGAHFAIKADVARMYLNAHDVAPTIGPSNEVLSLEQVKTLNAAATVFVECFGPPAKVAQRP